MWNLVFPAGKPLHLRFNGNFAVLNFSLELLTRGGRKRSCLSFWGFVSFFSPLPLAVGFLSTQIRQLLNKPVTALTLSNTH